MVPAAVHIILLNITAEFIEHYLNAGEYITQDREFSEQITLNMSVEILSKKIQNWTMKA